MPKVYPLRTQLNTGARTEGEDCGPVTIINVIKWASDNQIRIGQSDVDEWVRKIRVWARRPWGGFFLERDCLRVYRHPEFKALFTNRGLKPPTALILRKVSWQTTFMRYVKQGYAAHLPVNYGVLRWTGRAPVGSEMFNGDHYVLLLHAPRRSKYGRVIVWDGDPLFDGRRDGIPKGWQQAPSWAFRAAAGRWGDYPAGEGKCYAIVLRKG
jgi:hypothetical protein